jgi:uncharacterized membrane protein
MKMPMPIIVLLVSIPFQMVIWTLGGIWIAIYHGYPASIPFTAVGATVYLATCIFLARWIWRWAKTPDTD